MNYVRKSTGTPIKKSLPIVIKGSCKLKGTLRATCNTLNVAKMSRGGGKWCVRRCE